MNGPVSESSPADPQTIRGLLDRIVQKHHAFTRSAVGRIGELVKRSPDSEVEDFPAYIQFREAVVILANDLLAHLQKEESILFPYIGQLEESGPNAVAVSRPAFGSVANPIRMMRLEHEETDNVLSRIKRLTGEYLPAPGTSSELHDLLLLLKELEADLREHIRLEDDLLFPKAVELERCLFGEV